METRHFDSNQLYGFSWRADNHAGYEAEVTARYDRVGHFFHTSYASSEGCLGSRQRVWFDNERDAQLYWDSVANNRPHPHLEKFAGNKANDFIAIPIVCEDANHTRLKAWVSPVFLGGYLSDSARERYENDYDAGLWFPDEEGIDLDDYENQEEENTFSSIFDQTSLPESLTLDEELRSWDARNALKKIHDKDWVRARTVSPNRIDAMLNAITDPRKSIARVLAIYYWRKFNDNVNDIDFLNRWLHGKLSQDVINELAQATARDVLDCGFWNACDDTAEKLFREKTQNEFSIFNQRQLTDSLNESEMLDEENLEETYSDEELDDMIGKTFNQQKVLNIYRRTKYNDKRLFAHTRCVNCGREKRLFLSNLVNDPDKYGSCICSDDNVEGKLDHIKSLYDGSELLSSNTSGYTGVYFVDKYRGETYNKWRAYIETDGKRTYLGDFSSKAKAIKARKAAAQKGIKWYREHKNEFMSQYRRKAKRRRADKRINRSGK